MIHSINTLNKKLDLLTCDSEEKNEIHTVDMSKHIKKSNKKFMSSRGGKLIDKQTIRLRNCTKHISKNITISNDLMYLYGWFVAEGSKKGLTLNINEMMIS